MGGFVLLFLLLNLNPGEGRAAGRLQEMSGQAAGPRLALRALVLRGVGAQRARHLGEAHPQALMEEKTR